MKTLHGANTGLIHALIAVVGRRHVITASGAKRRYVSGYRVGAGDALAIVRPGSLVEQWRVASLCVAAGKIIIMQAANTGLTGGSTPFGEYDRDVVVINTMRLGAIHLLNDGLKAVCLPGATLDQLDRALRPLGREPHSEIGSSCLGASVIGGICNSSGGALVRRGPAYTEAALYGRMDETGTLHLVDRLGPDLGEGVEEKLANVESGNFEKATPVSGTAACSCQDYVARVRDVDAATPARFNADQRGLYEASGSAGRLILFAVMLDTFPRPAATRTFYIGSNAPGELTGLKMRMLKERNIVPVAGEYVHREMFRTAETYGKDSFIAIGLLGTDRLPWLFRAKAWADRAAASLRLPVHHLSDRLLQAFSRLLPQHLPRRMRNFARLYEHHLLIKVDGDQAAVMRDMLTARFPSETGDAFECSPQEAVKAFRHRFVAAGAGVRYDAVHSRGEQRLVAIDVALRRNDRDWAEFLPPELEGKVEKTLVYGHFFCNVFHQDFIVRNGADVECVKSVLLRRLAGRGAEYPAEHNVGHVYAARPQLAEFYRSLDPTNTLNPGIGKTSRHAAWAGASPALQVKKSQP